MQEGVDGLLRDRKACTFGNQPVASGKVDEVTRLTQVSPSDGAREGENNGHGRLDLVDDLAGTRLDGESQAAAQAFRRS